jgi:hypothetical protein
MRHRAFLHGTILGPFLVVGSFIIGAVLGTLHRPNQPSLVHVLTPYDVAARLSHEQPKIRVLHPAKEGLSRGLYFTTTAKPLEELLGLMRADPTNPNWQGTLYCEQEDPNKPSQDSGIQRIREVPGVRFWGDKALLGRVRLRLLTDAE